MTMTISFQNRGMPAVTTMKGDGMSKSNGCDSNGQNETEGTGGQRGRGQARSKADRSKTKQKTLASGLLVLFFRIHFILRFHLKM